VLLAISNVDLSPSGSGEEGHGSRPEQGLAGDHRVLLRNLMSRVGVSVELRVSVTSDHPGGNSSDNTAVSVNLFQTFFKGILGLLFLLKVLWVFLFDWLNFLVADAATLEDVLGVMAPVVLRAHVGGARYGDGELSILRLVLFNLSCRFFLEAVHASRNERSRESDSSNLSAKEELFGFENERVSVDLLFQVARELALGGPGGVDILGHEVGEEGPVAGLRGVGHPVPINIHAFTTFLLISFSLTDFSSIGGSFGDEVVGLGSCDLTPETHVSGGGLLSEGSQ